MRLAILGATGRTGRQLVAQALAAGHEVSALARDPSKLDGARERVQVVQGDATDAGAVERLVGGADVVLSALGPQGVREGGLHARSIAAVLAGMERRGVRRYLAVSGAGADAPGDRKALGDRIASRLMHLLVAPTVTDKEAELSALQRSGVEWVLVRPPRLTEGPLTGRYRVGLDVALGPRAIVSRADVAHFLLHQLEGAEWVGKAPFIRADEPS